MEFCQACGTRLKIALNIPNILACRRCGYEKAWKESNPISTVVGEIFKESIVVINQEEAGLLVQPTTTVDCPKCDGNKAYYRMIYASDDGETMKEVQIFRCTRCGHSRRENG